MSGQSIRAGEAEQVISQIARIHFAQDDREMKTGRRAQPKKKQPGATPRGGVLNERGVVCGKENEEEAYININSNNNNKTRIQENSVNKYFS